MWRSSVVVGWALLLGMLVTAHSWPIMGIVVGLAIAGHNEANENSINGDNKVSSKTSKEVILHAPGEYLFHGSSLLFSCHPSSQNPSTMKNHAYIPRWRGEAMWLLEMYVPAP